MLNLVVAWRRRAQGQRTMAGTSAESHRPDFKLVSNTKTQPICALGLFTRPLPFPFDLARRAASGWSENGS